MAIISEKIIKAFQTRIQHEEANSKLYNSMKNWLSVKGYPGASSLWKAYSDDELNHKRWSEDYLLSLDILPIEPSEEQPQNEFKGLANIIALTYQRELKTTEEVKQLAKECFEEGDFMSFGIAQKYVNEQIEEIDKILEWVNYLEQFGDSQVALQLLDQKMGEKVNG